MRIIQPARRGSTAKPAFNKSKGKEAKANSGSDFSADIELKSRYSRANKPKSCNSREYRSNESDLQANKLSLERSLEPLAPLDQLPGGKKRRRSELEHSAIQTNDQSLDLILDPAKKVFNELFAQGVRLLAMREHSVQEITKKLLDKSDRSDLVPAVVDDLLEKKYVSDERYTESYVRARGNRGFGPVKIRSELNSKGISSTLIQEYLNESSSFWLDNATKQYQKKYGDVPVSDYNTWTKRARFMQSRGFTMEHIHLTLPSVEFD